MEVPDDGFGLDVGWRTKGQLNREHLYSSEARSESQRNLVQRRCIRQIDAEPFEQLGIRDRNRRTGIDYSNQIFAERSELQRNCRTPNGSPVR